MSTNEEAGKEIKKVSRKNNRRTYRKNNRIIVNGKKRSKI